MRLPAKQQRAFAEFYRAARDNEQLDARTTLMIHLAAALAIGCYPRMEHYVARDAEGRH
jgi:hypothetical protein